jgi:hypothetical protein
MSKVFKNPMSTGKLPGIAKGGPSGVKAPMTGKKATAAVAAVPKKMPKKR